ncbi:LysM domain/BON superfamily protein [Pelagimonas phthalicica]|uniref:LysM domain/BON superfamily protein n=1 Tax=Pelagimonas phthalicica TaxID=1037362 RepID=A0A238JF71_9RHOB|nr:transporter substrate-binding domain-containing protein [Pelagimonas phthalicica]TDS91993.1 polar amino acid transport system substrate-binding protein [Pelagimonas phthalicica]SMX29043.1 LysM domain/BON superfamily protein [Pelagimonas phthalicica]
MKKSAIALAASLWAAGTGMVQAQETCGGVYKVKPGDSLSLIADKLYKDVSQWTVIYRNNIEKIATPDSIRVGHEYRIPCLGGLPRGLAGGKPVQTAALGAPAAASATTPDTITTRKKAAQRRQEGVALKLLAGDDFRPFTNRLQLSSGLITDLVNRVVVSAGDFGKHKFYWVNDRSVHLDPMLSEGMVDLAFPWRKPDCQATPSLSLCTDYVYSDPMFEMLVVLFTRKGSGVTYTTEADLDGMRVCSPLGHGTTLRQGQGADFLTRAGARLQTPQSAEDCFARLIDGTTDAVAMNEFTGRIVSKDMGVADQIELQLSRPLAIEGLHAVAHKSNPRSGKIIAKFNASLADLRESGEYLNVIDKHMSSIWAGL